MLRCNTGRVMSDKFDIGRVIALETELRFLRSRIEKLELAAAPARFDPPSAAEPGWRANYPLMSDHSKTHLFPCTTSEDVVARKLDDIV